MNDKRHSGLPISHHVALLLVGVPLLGEVARELHLEELPRVGSRIARWLGVYSQARSWVLQHLWWLVPATLLLIVLTILALRKLLMFWHNVVVARLAGTHLEVTQSGFPRVRFDLRKQLQNTPVGFTFVGRDPKKRPVYLSEWDLDTHGHIMGHTGCGKTSSVLALLMLQDLQRGKGVLFMDAKGSAENVAIMKWMVAITRRENDLRILALAHPSWSNTYNPVYLGGNGDPLVTAERVFSVFPLTHEYYGGQSKQFFGNLLRLMAGTGKPFNLVDMRLCITDPEVLDYVFSLSDEKAARWELTKQLQLLGRRRQETFTGLYNALADYDHPLLSAYAPDIDIDRIMNERGVVYFNLPANRYPILAPAIGKIVLQHVKAAGAMRQIDRRGHDQTAFSVNIDELNRFAFPELVPALNMLRAAHVQFRLSHQSLGDLEQVSPEFATQVKDNTRFKILFFENDPEHLEKVARSYGTRTAFKKTVRFGLGPLFTFLNTGEVSNREVEEFVLHPNALKNLAPQGQAYVLLPDKIVAINLEPLPRFAVKEHPLPRQAAAEGLNLFQLCVLGQNAQKKGA